MVDVTWLRPVCIAFRCCFDVQWHAPNAWCCSPWSHSNNGTCFVLFSWYIRYLLNSWIGSLGDVASLSTD